MERSLSKNGETADAKIMNEMNQRELQGIKFMVGNYRNRMNNTLLNNYLLFHIFNKNQDWLHY